MKTMKTIGGGLQACLHFVIVPTFGVYVLKLSLFWVLLGCLAHIIAFICVSYAEHADRPTPDYVKEMSEREKNIWVLVMFLLFAVSWAVCYVTALL